MAMLCVAVALLLCVPAISADTLSVRTRPGQCSVLEVGTASVVALEAVTPASAR